MPLFKPDDNAPDPLPSELNFPTTKKGWDPAEVTQYVEGLLEQHEEDLGAVVDRLRAVQSDHEQFSRTMEQQVMTLEEARDHAIARAEELEGVLREAQADTSSSEEIAALRAEVADAEERARVVDSLVEERDRLIAEVQSLRAGDDSGDQEARIRAEEQIRVLREQVEELRGQADNPFLQEASAQAVSTLEAELAEARERADRLVGEVEAATRRQDELEEQGRELQRRLELAESHAEARDGELAQTRSQLEEMSGLHHESLRQAAAAEAESGHLQREIARLREENPSISDTARRMQVALEELQSRHETEMAQVMEEAHRDADALRAAAFEEASGLARATIAELESTVAVYAERLEQARTNAAAATSERSSALETLHAQVGELLQSTQSAYAESFQFLQHQHEHEHADLAATRDSLLEEISRLEAHRGEIVAHLGRLAPDPAAEPTPEPTREDPFADVAVEPDFEPIVEPDVEPDSESAVEPDAIDVEDPFADVAAPVDSIDETVLEDDTTSETVMEQDESDGGTAEGVDLPIDLDQPVTVVRASEAPSNDPVVDSDDSDEVVHTAPDSLDVWAGFPSAPDEETAEADEEEPSPSTPDLPSTAPEPPVAEQPTEQPEDLVFEPDFVIVPREDSVDEDKPSVSDLARMAAPGRDREDEDHPAERTEEPAPRIFTEDD